MSQSQDHIALYLKRHDPDRYYATLVLPVHARAGVQAIYAFSADVAQTRERITEPTPGEIRLQYWVDLLSGTAHGNTSQNPLAEGLLHAIDQYDLPTGPLRRLLAARRFDLYDDAMPDQTAFEGYTGETNSILYQLATIIVNKGNDAGAAEAAGHMGVAHALIGHLRALPITAARGQIYLPWADFAQHGANEADYLAGDVTQGIILTCAALRNKAGQHLDQCTNAIQSLSPEVRMVFALIPILKNQLARLDDFANLPFAPPPDMPAWQKIAKIFWWSVQN